MQKHDAADLIAELKGLMPMLTEEQARVAFEAVMQRESPGDCRNAIRAYACDYEQFSLATFIDRLPPRPCDQAEPWDKAEFNRVKAERDAIKAQQDEDEAICNAMSDATFETLARKEIAKFGPEEQAFRCYAPHRKVDELRRSRRLTSLVAAHARAHGLVPGGLFQEASR